MTHEDKKTLRIGELYFHVRDLSTKELDAIKTLSGLRPFSVEIVETEAETDTNPEDQLLMNVIENAVQYASRDGFDVKDDEAFTNLASFAEYLLDALSLMAKVDQSELEEMLLASFMAKLTLDAMIYGGRTPRSVWEAHVRRAQALHDSCAPRPIGRH